MEEETESLKAAERALAGILKRFGWTPDKRLRQKYTQKGYVFLC